MNPISDLNAILQDGNCLDYDWLGYGPQKGCISIHQAGELVLTSGRIVPCDPLIVPDTRYDLKKRIEPGRYPVLLSAAEFQPIGDTRFACAKLQISDKPTARWEIALMNDPDPHQAEDLITYGVDAGTGCFLDYDAAEIIADLVSTRIVYPDKDEFDLFCDRVLAQMEQNSLGKYPLTAGWANMKLSEDTEANIISFSSGWGDGGYPSFWGYDVSGELTCLVTDFGLFL